MTERDWRIFREDFSIAYKGSAMGPDSLPLRNWEEARLPEDLMRAIERQVCTIWLTPARCGSGKAGGPDCEPGLCMAVEACGSLGPLNTPAGA